jgi:hypothetical protein
LHERVSRHAQTLLAELRDADGRGLPRHVDRELAAYLRCGLLARGFARVRCQACADEILVAFSCNAAASARRAPRAAWPTRQRTSSRADPLRGLASDQEDHERPSAVTRCPTIVP